MSKNQVGARLLDPVSGEFGYEDAEGTLLLIGTEDDGSVYISVNDREPVILPPAIARLVCNDIQARIGGQQA